MKAYKGFNLNMTCRGFQFKEGETYELPEGQEAKLCESGFHACEAPMDCLHYYAPAKSVYHEVELEDVSDERKGDTKRCAKRITVGAKLSIRNIVLAQVKFVQEKIGKDKDCERTSGDSSSAATSGDSSSAATSGYYSSAATSGDSSSAATSGYSSSAATSGNYSSAAAMGEKSIALANGYKAKAKGALGCWIVLTEWSNCCSGAICAKMTQVDGETIKPDTWYTLKDGEFVEVGEDD